MSAAPVPTATSTDTGLPANAFAHHPAFTGPAVRKWGQAALQAAYREVVEFAFREGWDSAGMRKEHPTLDDFARALTYFTPSSQADVRATVRRAEAGDSKARGTLFNWRYLNVTGPGGSRVIAGRGGVTNRSFTNGTVAIDASKKYPRLAITVSTSATLHLADKGGKTYTVGTHKKQTFWLVPNTGSDERSKPWLIDGLYSYQASDKAS